MWSCCILLYYFILVCIQVCSNIFRKVYFFVEGRSIFNASFYLIHQTYFFIKCKIHLMILAMSFMTLCIRRRLLYFIMMTLIFVIWKRIFMTGILLIIIMSTNIFFARLKFGIRLIITKKWSRSLRISAVLQFCSYKVLVVLLPNCHFTLRRWSFPQWLNLFLMISGKNTKIGTNLTLINVFDIIRKLLILL